MRPRLPRPAGALVLLLLLASCAVRATARAQAPADDSVAARLHRQGVRYDAPRAVLWADSAALDAAAARRFVALVSDGVVAIEALTGRTIDRAHYGDDRIHVFVSRAVTVSHVYGGYDHQRHARPYLYLNTMKVRRGEAPYLHEATHIVARRFGSHSLREGMASYVESVLSARGVGYHSRLWGVRDLAGADSLARVALGRAVADSVLPWIGRAGHAPQRVTSPEAMDSRGAYYVLAQSFAAFVASRAGMATLVRLSEAADEGAWPALTGRSLDAWKREWTASLQGAP